MKDTDWDLIFLAQMTNISNLACTYNLLKLKEELNKNKSGNNFKLLDCKNVYVSSCSSYILNPKSKEKISSLLSFQSSLGYTLPIDLLFMREINNNRLSCKFIFPYLVGLENIGDSSIQSHTTYQKSDLLEDQLNLFYIEADIDKLIEKYTPSDELIAAKKDYFVASQILFRRLIY
jgi:hypothetical protein